MASPQMPTSSLTQTVDIWTAQVVQASNYLTRLYRVLGDERQAYQAMQACGPCEERAQRLRLQPQIEKAWQLLIAASAGLCAFHGLVDDHEEGKNLRGPRTATNKAFNNSLRGYRTAFPEELTIPSIRQAIEQASLFCADAFSSNVDEATCQEKADLGRELHAEILETLMKKTEAEAS
jgi:hypothetical protein